MNTIAFISLRSGSKSIPLKNIKDFCGVPLATHCIKAATRAKEVGAVYIAYDDERIRDALGWWDDVRFLKVPKIDDYDLQEVNMLKLAKDTMFDKMVLLQATTPYTTSDDIDKAVRASRFCDSVVSVCRQHRFLWGKTQETAYPLNYTPRKRPRRQDWSGLYVENGAIFVTKRDNLLESKCRISGRVGLYEMPSYTYYEIDDETDWLIAEEIFKRRM